MNRRSIKDQKTSKKSAARRSAPNSDSYAIVVTDREASKELQRLTREYGIASNDGQASAISKKLMGRIELFLEDLQRHESAPRIKKHVEDLVDIGHAARRLANYLSDADNYVLERLQRSFPEITMFPNALDDLPDDIFERVEMLRTNAYVDELPMPNQLHSLPLAPAPWIARLQALAEWVDLQVLLAKKQYVFLEATQADKGGRRTVLSDNHPHPTWDLAQYCFELMFKTQASAGMRPKRGQAEAFKAFFNEVYGLFRGGGDRDVGKAYAEPLVRHSRKEAELRERLSHLDRLIAETPRNSPEQAALFKQQERLKAERTENKRVFITGPDVVRKQQAHTRRAEAAARLSKG